MHITTWYSPDGTGPFFHCSAFSACIMVEQLAEFEFEISDLPIGDVRKLLTTQDLKAPKIFRINDQTVKYFNTSYQAVIKSLMDLGYYKDGKDPYYLECDYLVKYA